MIREVFDARASTVLEWDTSSSKIEKLLVTNKYG